MNIINGWVYLFPHEYKYQLQERTIFDFNLNVLFFDKKYTSKLFIH